MEVVTPLVLLFSTNRTLTLLAVALMVAFHLFILSTFPLAVPLEWNLLFAYASIFLFLGFPAWDGYGVADMSSPWLTRGDRRRPGVLPDPRQPAPRPGLVPAVDAAVRRQLGVGAPGPSHRAPRRSSTSTSSVPTRTRRTQLLATYPPEVADVVMHQLLGWRSMHSQGRALFSLMMRHLGDDIDTYSLREAEFSCNSLVGVQLR